MYKRQDSDSDHLKINIGKGYITCFANDEHSKELNKLYQDSINSRKRVSTSGLEEKTDLIDSLQKELAENQEAMKLLKKNGYNDFTINRE